jgi:hypothetical protein
MLVVLVFGALTACDGGAASRDAAARIDADVPIPDAHPVPDARPDATPPIDAMPLPRVRFGNATKVLSNPNGGAVAPSLTSDQLTMYFSSYRDGTLDDVWVATRATTHDAWAQTSFAYVDGVSTAADDVTPFVSADGLTMWLARNDASNGPIYQILRSSRARTSDAWPPATLIATLGTGSGFSVTPDETLGFLSSTVSGKPHIYTSSRPDAHSGWSDPTPVTGIESDDGEIKPAISADGLELYYSTRAGLRVALRARIDDPFLYSEAVDEVSADAVTPWISPDGHALYFSIYDLQAKRYDVWMATR